MSSCESCCGNKDAKEKGDLIYVTAQFKKVEQSAREQISKIGAQDGKLAGIDIETPMEIINFTHLHGMCGDKVIAVNVKFGNVYYHVYILDESCDPQVVKILGPKEESVIITGFQ